jgi:hypothetical protein
MALLIVQDGIENNRLMKQYVAEHDLTGRAVEEWISNSDLPFRSVTFERQEAGLGTAGTARRIVDIALEAADEVIFSEDDVIFSHDALAWFSSMLANEVFLDPDVWAIAGESKHFDLKSRSPTLEEFMAARSFAIESHLIDKFVFLNVMPSSCFATNRSKWREFGLTRGEPRGPRLVNDRCRAEKKFVLWPVVARCADIGMHHAKGYSMTLKKSAEAIPGKATYLTSDNLSISVESFVELPQKIAKTALRYFGR